jgi:hypothetical protein
MNLAAWLDCCLAGVMDRKANEIRVDLCSSPVPFNGKGSSSPIVDWR